MVREKRTPWSVSISSLSQRAGQTMDIDGTMPAPDGIGDAVIGIPKGSPVYLSGTAESLPDGLLFTGTVRSMLSGECTRCLKPVSIKLAPAFAAFFTYEGQPQKLPHGEEEIEADGDSGDPQDVYPLDPKSTMLSCETLIRDNLAEALPSQLLCSPDCKGLCPQCGIDLNENPEHRHETTDLRWAELENFRKSLGES